MGMIHYGNVIVCGNFAEVQPSKPANFDYDSDAKWLEPFPKDWERIKIGKTTCDCEQIETHYEPWYGFTWFHTEKCAIVRRVKEKPGLLNLPAFYDYETIGYSL